MTVGGGVAGTGKAPRIRAFIAGQSAVAAFAGAVSFFSRWMIGSAHTLPLTLKKVVFPRLERR